jgi:hypothetical protein
LNVAKWPGAARSGRSAANRRCLTQDRQSPETAIGQASDRDESFNGKLRNELLNGKIAYTPAGAGHVSGSFDG